MGFSIIPGAETGSGFAPLRGVLAGLTVLFLLAAAPAGAQLCPPAADPCIVSSPINVAAGTIDLGVRTLVIQDAASITVVGAELTITAGAVRIEPGGRLLAPGAGGDGGAVVITTTGAIEIGAAGTKLGRIDVSGSMVGGLIDLTSGTSITINGLLDAHGLDGGFVNLSAVEALTIGPGGIFLRGGGAGGGGFLAAFAGTGITVTGPIDVRGGEFDAGEIELETDGNLTTGTAGTLDASASGFGYAGIVSLRALGSTTINGDIDGHAGAGIESGSGAEVTVEAGGDLTLIGDLMLSGAGGGLVDLAALGTLVQSGNIDVDGLGTEGCSGDAVLGSNEALTLGNISARGAFCGGFIDVTAVDLDVIGSVRADAINPFGTGGTNTLHACQLTVSPGAAVSAGGPNGMNVLMANGSMVIRAPLTAGGSNRLEYETVLPSVLVVPVPVPQIVQTTLPACGLVSPTTSTTSPTSTTSLTTSTLPVTSSTTTTPPTTTSTTVIVPPPTTTTTSSTSTSSTSTAPVSTTTTATASSSTTTLPLPLEEVCGNGVDDDGDGLADCADPDCVPSPGCGPCPVAPTFDSIECRLDVLEVAVTEAGNLGVAGVRLLRAVRAVQARQADAEAACAARNTRLARDGLRRALRRLIGFKQQVRGLVHRGLLTSPALSDTADHIRDDTRTLRSALACRG